MKQAICTHALEATIAREFHYAILGAGMELDPEAVARLAFAHAEAFVAQGMFLGYLEVKETTE